MLLMNCRYLVLVLIVCKMYSKIQLSEIIKIVLINAQLLHYNKINYLHEIHEKMYSCTFVFEFYFKTFLQ